MRWSFKRMWACIIVFAMLGFAFVGLSSNTRSHGVESPGTAILDNGITEGTRGPGADRVVLLERFTNCGCPPCVGPTQAEEVFTDDYGIGRLAVIKYHVHWPDANDPMHLNNDQPQIDRRNYYGPVPYVPYTVVDGVLYTDNSIQVGTYPIKWDTYYNFYETRVAIPSPFTIDIDASLGATTGSVSVDVTAVDTVPGGTLKLRMALYLNNVDYPAAPGSNGETHFEYTFLDFIPSSAGLDLTISMGQTVNFGEVFNIPTEIAAGGGDPAIPVDRAQLGIVAWIQDDVSKEVHQSGVKAFADLSVSPTGVQTVPLNPNVGDMVVVSAWVVNNGEPISQAYATAYIDQVGGNQIGPAIPTGPMSTGQTKIIGLGAWDTTGQAGHHRIYVKVDVNNDFTEYDEMNNVAMKDVNVAAQFDVGVSQINPFQEAMMYPMSNYSMEGVIGNFGQNAMGDFNVTIQLMELGSPDVPDQTYFTDFEPDAAGWTEAPLTSSWAYGTPSVGPGAYSGTKAWVTNLAGDYPAVAHDWLMSPIFDLPSSASSISLTFYHFYAFQSTTTSSPPIFTYYNDCGNLWLSTNAGKTWDLLNHYVDNNGAYEQVIIDLSSYAGQSVRMGWELVSDMSVGGMGWYIDDVEIVSMVPSENQVWIETTRLTDILSPGGLGSLSWNHKIINGGAHKLYIWTPMGGDQNPQNDIMSVTFDIDPTKWRNMFQPVATLVSSPLILTESDIANIVAVGSNIESVRTYSTTMDEWYAYMPSKPANSLLTIDHKMGMWVTANTNGYIDFTGTVPGVTVDIQLVPGWNLVGYPSMTDRTVADALIGVGYDRIEAFDPVGPYNLKQLSDTDWMTAGQAYWIHVSAGTTWSVAP